MKAKSVRITVEQLLRTGQLPVVSRNFLEGSNQRKTGHLQNTSADNVCGERSLRNCKRMLAAYCHTNSEVVYGRSVTFNAFLLSPVQRRIILRVKIIMLHKAGYIQLIDINVECKNKVFRFKINSFSISIFTHICMIRFRANPTYIAHFNSFDFLGRKLLRQIVLNRYQHVKQNCFVS